MRLTSVSRSGQRLKQSGITGKTGSQLVVTGDSAHNFLGPVAVALGLHRPGGLP